MRIGGLGPGAVDFLSPATARGNKAASAQLSPEVQSEVQRLKQIDQKVRAHEQAHLSAAAGLSSGGASFQTVRGPDGRQYAVGGEVRIDVSPAATPEQTAAKAQRIRAAALAPADPSSQDRAVAAGAGQLEAQARAEVNRQKQDGTDAENPLEQALRQAQEMPDKGVSKAIQAYRQGEASVSSRVDVYA